MGGGRTGGDGRVGRWAVCAAAALLLVLAGVDTGCAQAWWDTAPNGIPAPSIATSLPQNGDPAGIRKRLAEHGIVYGLEYTNDVLSNLHGGNRTGTIDQGRLHGILTIDFERLAGWQGLSFFTNFFQMHNTGRIRRDYVGAINSIAAIEGVPTTRLSEVWIEQKFAGGTASLRVGQLAADAEFFISQMSTVFLQSDWPTIAAANLPSGGAAYPLSTPGVRLKVDPTPDVAFLLAVLNGDPAGPGEGDDEHRNLHGVNFRVNDPAFVIAEAQFKRNRGDRDTGLATTLKLGGWHHFGRFADRRFAVGGGLLADPRGSGVPIQHRGDSGVYAVLDQQLWRPAGGGPDSGISVYTRASLSPSDRNPINAYIDGGIMFAGLIASRPDDKFGASVIYSRFSDSLRGFDSDAIALAGAAGPVRDHETSIEATYIAQIVPGWTLQPDVQFIRHAGGNSRRNATVAGMRSMWRF